MASKTSYNPFLRRPQIAPRPAAHTETLSQNAVSPPLTGRLLGSRIAQRIFVGYVVPLLVLLALGFALPILLWSYLGQAKADLNERSQMAERGLSLRVAANDCRVHAVGFLRYHDKQFEDQFLEARGSFRVQNRELVDFADKRQNAALTRALDDAAHRYSLWLRSSVNTPFRIAQMYPSPGPNAPAVSHAAWEAYAPVDDSLMRLVFALNRYRDSQKPVARAAETLRYLTAVVSPLCAVLLSLLVGRSLALGITRPLETLIRATEQLEQGKGAAILLEEDLAEATGGELGAEDTAPDDEIGDLQRSFRRMARTIRQREAVLQTQNEAFGALIRRIEAVLNATNDGILLIDRSGGFSLVNQRLADLFGLRIEELQDHTWMQAGPLLLARFRSKAMVRDRIRAILDDAESITDETFDTEGPGALRSLRVYSAPVRGAFSPESGDEETLGRIFVFRDVTRETLVDRMKTEFVSTVSHELRTPLTAIRGYVDLMVSGQTGPLTPIQADFLTLVQGSTRRLTTLINDMLDISRIESGRMEIRTESVPYPPLIDEAVRLLQGEADSRNITLRVEIDGGGFTDANSGSGFPHVLGDADRITQVITNFLSNGIKYTPPGGTVTIRVEFEEDFVTTCVADTGIGISPEDQRRLFQKFFRADNSTTREAGGTGLGLAITKAILEKLHGSVWVDSVRGEGSRFWFTLPTVMATSASATNAPLSPERILPNGNGELPPADSAAGSPPPTAFLPHVPSGTAARAAAKAAAAGVHQLVLSIGGDVSMLHRIGHELRRQGFVTSNAATVADALRRARDLRPDLITLDPLSPGLDGWETLRTLREHPVTRSLPIALVTPQMIGGRAELLDTIEYLPRRSSEDEWEALFRVARERSEGNASPPSLLPVAAGGTILLIAEGALAEHLHPAVRRVAPDGEIIVVDTEEAGDQIAASGWKVPALIVLDTRVLPGTAAGAWVQRFRRRHPGVAFTLLIATEDDLAAGGAVSLLPLGGGTVPLEDIGLAIHALLEHGEFGGRHKPAIITTVATG